MRINIFYCCLAYDDFVYGGINMKRIAIILLCAVLLLAGCESRSDAPQEVNLSRAKLHELELPQEYAQTYKGHNYGKRLGCNFVYDSEYFYMRSDTELVAVNRADCSETLLADIGAYCDSIYKGVADVFAVTPDSVLCYYYDQTGQILSLDKQSLEIKTYQLDGIQNTGMMQLVDNRVYYVNQLDYGVYVYDIESEKQECIYKKEDNTLIVTNLAAVGDYVYLFESDEDEWNQRYVKIKNDGSGCTVLKPKKNADEIAWFNLHDYNYKSNKTLNHTIKQLGYQDIDMLFTGGILGETSAGVYYIDNDITINTEKSSEQYELGSGKAVSDSGGGSVYRMYEVKKRTISKSEPQKLFSFTCDVMDLSHELIICGRAIYYYDVDIKTAEGQWKRYDV